jgi:hypothetical protein
MLLAAAASAASFKVQTQASLASAKRWIAFDDGSWVKVQKGRLEFYSPKGSRQRLLNLRGNEVLTGPHGCQAVGVVAYADRQPKTLRAVTFDLFNPAGKQLFRLNDPDFATAIVAGPGNALVGIDGAEGLPRSVLRFYNGKGKLQDSLVLERFEGGAFCDDGSKFLYETAADGLQVCTDDGRPLATLGKADRWVASSDATMIAKSVENRLYFYRNGELVQTFAWDPGFGKVRALALSPDGNHAAVASATDAAIIEVESARVLWQTAVDRNDWNFRSIDLTNGATLVAIGSDFDPGPDAKERHQRSRCQVFDQTGQILHVDPAAPAKWGAKFPIVQFNQAGTALLFADRDQFKVLRLDQ